MNSQYDGALLGILQNEGQLQSFLDVIFSFLMRRTDMFYVRTPTSQQGFPQHVALKIVIDTFNKYNTLFQKYQERYLSSSQASEKSKNSEDNATAEEANVKTTDETNEDKAEKLTTVKPKCETKQKKKDDGPGVYMSESKNGERFYVADEECYNGAKRPGYSWSQTIRDIDIRVKIPESVKSGKDVIVKFDAAHLRIDLKGQTEPLIDEDFLFEIKKPEACWSVDFDEGHILFNLDKAKELWWEAAFKSEERINVQKIDCSRPMHELDDEVQAKIAQLLFDEDQKRKGLPTLEQMRLEELMSKIPNRSGAAMDPTMMRAAMTAGIDPSAMKLPPPP